LFLHIGILYASGGYCAKKYIPVFDFIYLVFIQNSIIFAAVSQDQTDTLAIQWDTKTAYPFFNKWEPYGVGARAIGMGEAFAR